MSYYTYIIIILYTFLIYFKYTFIKINITIIFKKNVPERPLKIYISATLNNIIDGLVRD